MGKSFLQRLLNTYKKYETISIGKESIIVEVKDLFKNAFYSYIILRFNNFEKGIETLSEYGIEIKDSIHIYKDKNSTYSLKITYKENNKIINNIDAVFEDEEGHYNKKGYYDEETVKKFNTLIFRIFDEIVGGNK